MNIAFGSDHAGFALKEFLRDTFKNLGIQVIDLGTHYPTPADYPVFAKKVGDYVAEGKADFGILICGSGLGMSISANKVAGIRAAFCPDEIYAELARRHNNANILCLGSRFIKREKAFSIADKFLKISFDGNKPQGERHKRRVQIIDEII